MSCSLLNCFLELDRLVDCLYCWLWCYGLFHCRLGSSCYRLLWLIVHFRLVVNLAGLSVECYDCWLILLDRRRSLRFHCFVLGRLHRKWHPEWLIILKMILLIFFLIIFENFLIYMCLLFLALLRMLSPSRLHIVCQCFLLIDYLHLLDRDPSPTTCTLRISERFLAFCASIKFKNWNLIKL